MPDGFLRAWVVTNVKVVMAWDHAREAKRLAAVCAAEAAKASIDPDALEAAAGGDLVNYMGEAIDRVTMAEVDRMLERMRPKDAPRSEETG